MEVTRAEQYAALKFCFRLHRSSAEVYTMLQEAYGSSFFHTAQLEDGINSLKRGDNQFQRKVDSNIAAVIVREDRRITLRSLSETLKISLGSTHTLVTEKLNMRLVCARWVSRLLILKQQDFRIRFACD